MLAHACLQISTASLYTGHEKSNFSREGCFDASCRLSRDILAYSALLSTSPNTFKLNKKSHQHAPTTVVMRLITHNMLKSNVKGVINGFPLRIEAEKVEVKETEFNSEFVQNLLPKVDWPALRGASKELDMDELPEEMDEANKTDDAFLQLVHKLLLDVHVLEGTLVCPETGRRFPINNGIPNMLLHEDEVA